MPLLLTRGTSCRHYLDNVSNDEDMRPLGERTPGQRAISYAIIGGFMGLGTLLAAIGALGYDRLLRLAVIYVIGPPIALYCLLRACQEGWVAVRQRRRNGT